MIPAYYAYRHYKKKGAAKMNGEVKGRTIQGSPSFDFIGCENETFCLRGVYAKKIDHNEDGDDVYVNGKLAIVEKPHGVMIEWMPIDDDGWIIAISDEEEDRSSRSSESILSQREVTDRLKFSVDIKDLSSFICVEPKTVEELSWIRFTSKDGLAFTTLYFQQTGITAFIDHLKRYATLKRSAREANLVLFTDESISALEQSVSMLNLNSDFFSRAMAQPYATALTGLGRVASFVQDQLIPSLLDTDAVSAEENIRAMRELREREEEEAGKLRLHDDCGFELVTLLELPQRPTFRREQPVDEKIWNKFKNPDGSFSDVHTLKALIFRGGLVNSLRKEAWKYLLNAWNWKLSTAENEELLMQKAQDYYRMKLQWKTMSIDQENRFSDYASRKALIEKDVSRTDRTHPFFSGPNDENTILLNDVLMTYCMYNFDLGYVQGMSDFLSPLLVIVQSEVDAFWCFVGLMNRVHRNFEMDQSAIKKQLIDLRDLIMVVNPKFANYLEANKSDDMYFCFRWMLVAFKREFSFENILRLWEVLWTNLPCPNFHLLICVAILDSQMNFIIENQFGLTEILKHINDLSMNIEFDEALSTAEAIYHQLSASQDKLPRHICKILSLGDDSNND